MTPRELLECLSSLQTWASPENDRAAAATALGDLAAGFRATGRLVGDHELAELAHEATGTGAVVVPGARFRMGFSGEEIAQLRADLGPPDAPGYETWLERYERVFAATPGRGVAVHPFVCAETPVLDPQIADRFPELTGHCPLEEEIEADLTPLSAAEAAAEEEHLWDDDDWDALRPYPAFVGAADARRVLESFEARCPSDAEWELIARAGGHGGWIANDPWTFVADFHAHPVFEGDGKWTRRTTNGLGIWGLALPEWTRELDGPELVLRGGAVTGFPWQDGPEVISAHAAIRGLWSGEGAVRAVWNLVLHGMPNPT